MSASTRNDPGPGRGGREAGPWGVRLARTEIEIRPGREHCNRISACPNEAHIPGLCAPAQNLEKISGRLGGHLRCKPRGLILTDHDLVLVVDFGAQYAQLIARRVREAKVYSEIVPHTTPVAEILARKPAAIILSGGPSSVYAPGAPGVDAALFDADVPVFGMCYGFQAMAQVLGGEVARTGISEYGRTPVRVTSSGTLLADIPREHRVWMSHGDSVRRAPEGFDVLATTAASPVAAFENTDRRLAGVQWHPEVLHTENGQKVMEHFLLQIAGCRPTWTMVNIVEEQIERIREQSAGVDDAHWCPAVLGDAGPRDLSAEGLGHCLEAVAHAEDGDVCIE